jgi:hypothetical protein
MEETPSLVVQVYVDIDCVRWPVVPLSILVLSGHAKKISSKENYGCAVMNWPNMSTQDLSVPISTLREVVYKNGNVENFLLPFWSICIVVASSAILHTFVEQMSSRRPDDTKH